MSWPASILQAQENGVDERAIGVRTQEGVELVEVERRQDVEEMWVRSKGRGKDRVCPDREGNRGERRRQES
jgi:hypothetical protein